MDNKETPIASGAPELNQPVGQPMPQPVEQQPMVEQPAPQPIVPEPMPQPIATPVSDTAPTPKKKNSGLIIGCIAGVVGLIAIALVAVFVVVPLLTGGEKTVICNSKTETFGVPISWETTVNVGNGKIESGKIVVEVDLKNMRDSYKEYEEEYVESLTEEYEEECQENCTLSHEYKKGESVKYTLSYDEDGVDAIVWGYGYEKLSAQEIANMVQERLEDSDTTCRQQ